MKSLGLILLLTLTTTALARVPDNLVKAELLSDTAAAQPGKPFTIGLHLAIADGWHVYWSNPGDAGSVTTLKLTVPPGYSVGPVQYPVPEKITLPGDLVIYAYQKELLLTAVVTPPSDLNGVPNMSISANAAWCVCNPDECILGKKTLDLNLPVGTANPANSDLFAAWQSRMSVDSSLAFSISPSNGQWIARWYSPPPATDFQWLPAARDDLKVDGVTKTTGRSTLIALKVQPITGIKPTSSKISGILAYYSPGQPPRGFAVTLDRPAAN